MCCSYAVVIRTIMIVGCVTIIINANAVCANFLREGHVY